MTTPRTEADPEWDVLRAALSQTLTVEMMRTALLVYPPPPNFREYAVAVRTRVLDAICGSPDELATLGRYPTAAIATLRHSGDGE